MRLKIGLAALAAVALMAFVAASASATTLEIGGVAQNKSVTMTATLEPGGSVITRTTGESFVNTCTEATLHGSTSSPFTGTKVTGAWATKAYSKCTEESLVVDNKGGFWIEWIPGTTEGDVFDEGSEVTVPTPFGKVNCKTGAGTKIGRLTGVASGKAKIDLNGVMNCGFLLPSVIIQGTLVVTSPAGFGVTS